MSGPRSKSRHRSLRYLFLAGFILTFVGMSLACRVPSLQPSGGTVVEVALWEYYLTELGRAMASPRLLGPGSRAAGAALLVAYSHLFCSTVVGAAFAGMGWVARRLGRRDAPTSPEQLADGPITSPGSPSFRDVPWRWRDVLIGLAPLVAMISVSHLISPRRLDLAPNRLWIPITLLSMAWMFAYPLRIARRRVGLPPLPGLRAVFFETLLAVPSLWFVMTIVSIVAASMVHLFGEAARPSVTLEPIAASSDRLQKLALIFLAVFVAPLDEEIFFRGMLYNALRRRLRPALAAVLQAVIFGLIHPFGFAERMVITVIGFCIALLYEWRRTLLAPILLHAAINAAAMGAMFWRVAADADAPVIGVWADAREKGCAITRVAPASAAEESGLRVGDVIAAIDGEPVSDPQGLIRVVRKHKVGEGVAVDYFRNGEAKQVKVTLKRRPK